ncbi:MAG: glycosyltransferase [Candidatus Eisenbacteria sp.]|nr:glycosyltransferase [Candidatus Eisenbacteria bacterium]
MHEDKLTVAHLVSPYLFQTCSWIHTQLTHAHDARAIVLTHALDHPERFPFEPIFHTSRNLSPLRRIRNKLLYLAGRFDPGLYLPVLREQRASLIHAHMGWEGVRALPIARAAALPLVTSFYGRDAGVLPRFPWWRLRFRQLFKQGAAFFVEGPHLGQTLQALGCPAAKIHILHLGIQTKRIPFARRAPGADGSVEILVSASMRSKKGVPAAVGAFAAMASQFPKARLRILGDGPQRMLVEERIRRHRLNSRVTLEGYVSYERHLQALERAHIFLAPSRTSPSGDTEGGAPVSIIEAQAAGLPIISTHHADIPEVVEDGGSGLLSPEFDNDALARNLQWMLEHPQHWPAMGRAGRERVEREFDADLQAKAATVLYRSLI